MVCAPELGGQVSRIVGPAEQAAARVCHQFREAAVIGDHDRHAVGQRLQRRQAFALAVDGQLP